MRSKKLIGGLRILRCSDHCDIIGLIKGEKKFKGAHWHCYKCKNGFNRRNEAIKHYKTHFRHPGTTFQIHISQNVARTEDVNFSSEPTTAEKSLLFSVNGMSAIILNGQGNSDSEGTCAMANISESSGEVETADMMIVQEEDPCGVSSSIVNSSNTEETEDSIGEDLKLDLKTHIKKLKDKEIREKALEKEIIELKAQLLTHKKELEKAHQREQKLLKQLNKSVNAKQEELPLSFQSQPSEFSKQQIIQFQIQKQDVQCPALALDTCSGFLSQTVPMSICNHILPPVPVSMTVEPTLQPHMVTSSTFTSTHQSLPSFSENSLTPKDSDFLSFTSGKSSNELNKAPFIVTVSQVNSVPKVNSASSSGTDNLPSHTGRLGQPINVVSIPVVTSVPKGSQILSGCNFASPQKTALSLSPPIICSAPNNQVPGPPYGLKGTSSSFTFMQTVPASTDLASIPSQNSHTSSGFSSVSSMSKTCNVGESPSNYYLVQTNPISSGAPYVSSDVSKNMTLSPSSLPITKLYECERISDNLALAQRSPNNLSISNVSPILAHTVSVSAFPSFTTKARQHARNSSDNLVVHVVPVTSSSPGNTHSTFTTRDSEPLKEALPSFCIPATTGHLIMPLSKELVTTGGSACLTLSEMVESSSLEESSFSKALCAAPVVVEYTIPSTSSTGKRVLSPGNTHNKRIK
ncbi:mucin-12-like isoform X2 [Limulus polyphemus]|uniref:Mucin-12-like isoform X2 n=1 Tax=Limulus polyphemus TaxID=6850 RepID=A0ABM1SR97_LIMPO|nr:mucin-12-like isoform X2 [Limulus polyphemus]